MPTPAREVDFDVLPTKGSRPAAAPFSGDPSGKPQDPLSALIAKLMDSMFTVPGTNIRFGLDPLLGMLPGVGSGASSLMSILLLVRSARLGVPNVVIGRMGINILTNALLDALPIIGGPLSIFFRSNDRNYRLFQQYAGQKKRGSRGDWAVVIGVLAGVIFAIFSVVAMIVFLAGKVLQAIF